MSFENQIWLWPVKWVDFFPEKYPLFLFLAVGGFALSALCAVFPHKSRLRALVFVFNMETIASLFSPDAIGYYLHSILIVSFFLIFLNLDKKGRKQLLFQERNKFHFLAAQVSFLGIYFLFRSLEIKGSCNFSYEQRLGRKRVSGKKFRRRLHVLGF